MAGEENPPRVRRESNPGIAIRSSAFTLMKILATALVILSPFLTSCSHTYVVHRYYTHTRSLSSPPEPSPAYTIPGTPTRLPDTSSADVYRAVGN